MGVQVVMKVVRRPYFIFTSVLLLCVYYRLPAPARRRAAAAETLPLASAGVPWGPAPSGHALERRLHADAAAAAGRRGRKDCRIGCSQHTAQLDGDVCERDVHVNPAGARQHRTGSRDGQYASRARNVYICRAGVDAAVQLFVPCCCAGQPGSSAPGQCVLEAAAARSPRGVLAAAVRGDPRLHGSKRQGAHKLAALQVMATKTTAPAAQQRWQHQQQPAATPPHPPLPHLFHPDFDAMLRDVDAAGLATLRVAEPHGPAPCGRLRRGRHGQRQHGQAAVLCRAPAATEVAC